MRERFKPGICFAVSRRKYRHAPIQEAICEIHFSDAISQATLKEMQPVWLEKYPSQTLKDEEQFDISVKDGNLHLEKRPSSDRLICRSADKKRIVQLSSRFIAVNQISPYEGWSEAFLPCILDRFSELKATFALGKIVKVTLRYVDRMQFPEKPIEWSKWLALNSPPSIGGPVHGGNVHINYGANVSDQISVNVALIGPVTTNEETFTNFPPHGVVPENCTTVLLDATVAWNGCSTGEDIEAILAKVHEPHTKLFNDSLTSRSKNLFGEYFTDN